MATGKSISIKNLEYIHVQGDKTGTLREEDIVSAFTSQFDEYKKARTSKELTWLECWAKYMNSPEANEWVRSQVSRTVGDVSTDWRHRISTSKAYEVVETINAYIQGATFVGHNWFALEPVYRIGDPDYQKLLDVLTKYLNKKLDDANFESNWDMFCRQMIITGTSVLALPWRYDVRPYKKNQIVQFPDQSRPTVSPVTTEKVYYNGLDIEVLDMFDVWLDPAAKTGQTQCGLYRKFKKTRGELMQLIDAEVYPLVTRKECEEFLTGEAGGDPSYIRTRKGFGGINETSSPADKLDIVEFWGNLIVGGCELRDIVATVCNGNLLSLTQNPFWHGAPFVIGTYTPVISSPYGLGVLEPCLGNLHVQDLTLNQRLDGVEITLNPMYEVTNDGTIDVDDVYSEPGKVFLVSQPGTIRPIAQDRNFQSSVQEEQMQEQRIDKSTGVGAYLGVNSGRDGERVTAEEVKTQKDAGGNRLNRVQSHITKTALRPCLLKSYGYCQQFVVEDEVIRIKSRELKDGYEYIKVGVQELSFDMDINPQGADHVADKEYEIKQRMDFIQLVSGIEPLAQSLNWEEILKDLARRFLEGDADKYIKPAETAPQQPTAGAAPQGDPTQGMAPPGALQDVLSAQRFAGGQPAVNATQMEIANKGLAGALGEQAQAMGIGAQQ